jgi:predicted nucleic acid-binding protein
MRARTAEQGGHSVIQHRRRVYCDTSVFGGVFDEEFAEPTLRFLDEVRAGHTELVVSTLVRDEVVDAPPQVQRLFAEMLALGEMLEVSEAASDLREAYLRAGVVTRRWAADALHVALATVAGCTVIVSWNFTHIVHIEKTPLYQAVNTLHGYPLVTICSPPEVIRYAEEEGL